MALRNFVYKVLSLLAIFAFLFSYTPVALAQQPEPATPTPSAPVDTPTTPGAAAPTVTPAQAPTVTTVFTISGKVTGKEGQPLAEVSISDDHGNQTNTAADGSYALPGLQPGTYLVTPRLEGQALIPFYRVVTLVDKEVSGVDFYPPKTPIDTGQAPFSIPMYAGHPYSGLPAQAPVEPGGDLSAQAVYTAGAPGLVYRYQSELGTVGKPYLVESSDDIHYLNSPAGIALDHAGNLLAAEQQGSRIVRFNKFAGHSDLVIGKAGMMYTENYAFNMLSDVVERPSEQSLWASDNSHIIKYTSDGTFVLEFPANNPWENGSDDGHFNQVAGIAFSPGGDEIFVSDRNNDRIQAFAFDVLGNPVFIGTIGAGNPGSDHLSRPGHLTDYTVSIYIADTGNHRILKCGPNPDTSSCTNFLGVPGEAGGDISHLSSPSSIAFGTLSGTDYAFIADTGNQRVLRCNADGTSCVHFAGTAGEPGTDNSHFAAPVDITFGEGMVYVADQYNQRIQVFDGSNTDPLTNWVMTYGTSGVPYQTDELHVNNPWGIVAAPGGSLYVAEQFGYALVKYTYNSTTHLYDFKWRSGEAGVFGADVDHLGSRWAGSAGKLALDSAGRIYVPDEGNNRVMIYLPDGSVVDAWGSYGTDNDHFACPAGVAIRPDNGDIYIADQCNQRIQVFDSQRRYKGTIGVTGISGSDSGHFNDPFGPAVDSNGNVYVADYWNHRIQKCRLNGSSFTCVPFAGQTGVTGPDFRYINGPVDVSIGPDGLIYVVEEWQKRVEVFDPSGAYRTTLGGNWGAGTGELRNPRGVTVDTDNNVYVTDSGNARVVKYARGLPSMSGLPGWSQLNVNGWGGQENSRVSPLKKVTLNGLDYLYAGTGDNNNQPDSPRVWRMTPDGTWQAVSAPGFGDPANQEIIALETYNGYLYAGTNNNSGKAQIWRCLLTSGCDQDSDWSEKTPPDLGSNNYYVTGMIEFNSKFYVSVTNYYMDGNVGKTQGAELWELDGENWSTAPVFTAGNFTLAHPENGISNIQTMIVFHDQLILGTLDWVNNNPAQLWSYVNDSTAPVKLRDDHDIAPGAEAVGYTSLAVFIDHLYVGTTGTSSGPRIYRYATDFLDNETVASWWGGEVNNEIRGLVADTHSIYVVVADSQDGLQIWNSSSGDEDDWHRFLSQDGFGSNLNYSVDPNSSLLLANDRLYVGTLNWANGGGLWASAPIPDHSISGTVTVSGTLPPSISLDSMALTLQPGEKTTTPDAVTGIYSINKLANGRYTITPARTGCQFSPAYQTVTVSGGDVTIGADFVVTCTAVNLLSPADGTQLDSRQPLTLSWSAISGATKYNLQVSTNQGFLSTIKNVTQAGTSYVLTGISAGATYYWRVKEAVPVGSWSVTWIFYAPKPPAAPYQILPANGATLTAGNFRPLFTWKPAAVPSGGKPVEHYHLQVSQKNTFDGLDLDEYTRDASISYTAPFNLTPNRVYYWRMRAFNTSGGYGGWSSVRSFKTLPGAIYLAWIQDQDTLRPTFHWGDDWNTGKYTIQVCKPSGSTCSLFKSATLNGLAYTLTTSLAANTDYRWRAQAVGIAGAGLWTGYWEWTTPTPPAQPALVWPPDNASLPDATHSGYRPTIDWGDVTGSGVYYQFQISTEAGFYDWSTRTFKLTPPTLSQFQPAEDLLFNQAYWWRVRSCGSDNKCSVWAGRKLLMKPAVPIYGAEDPSDPNNGDITSLYHFSWTDDNQNQANKYTIQVFSNSTCTNLFKSATVTNSWEYRLVLPSDKDMCWRVRGEGVTNGDWMSMHPFHTVITPGVPVLVFPANNAVAPYEGITATWKPASGAQCYQFQMSDSSTFNYSYYDEAFCGGNSYGFNYFGTVYWRVRAQTEEDGNWSQWSEVRKVLFKPNVGGIVSDLMHPVQIRGASVTLDGSSTTTDYNGGYGFDKMSTGTKTLTVTAPNFLPMIRNLTLVNGVDYSWSDVWLVPVGPSLGYRFVLSWDPLTRRDLDLHAWLPAAAPDHISFLNQGKLGSFPNAQLIVHDIAQPNEVMDFMPFQTGKTVLGVKQWYPAGNAWSATNVKVEVYLGTVLQQRCVSPSGSGTWWYVMDVTMTGSVPTFTCKNKIQSVAPAPYPDQSISGTINQSNGRPLQGVTLEYGEGSAIVDSPYILPGLGPRNYTLSPSKTNWSFGAPITVTIGATDADFVANPLFDITGKASSVITAQGDYLYVGGGGKLYIVDARDKSNLVEKSAFWIAPDTITDMVVQGNYAYVAEGDSGLNILDVSDPSNPKFIGLYAASGIKRLAISGHYAYLAAGTDLIVVDIGDLSKPAFVTDIYFDPPGEEDRMEWANVIAVQGNYAYLASNDMYIYNISNPARPAYVASLHIADEVSTTDITFHNGYIYVMESGGLSVLNNDDPNHPYQFNSTSLPYDVSRGTVQGDKFYVADPTQGFLIYDISKPWENLPQLGAYKPAGSVIAVVGLDNYAYIIEGADILAVDVAKPSAPTPAGSYTPAP